MNSGTGYAECNKVQHFLQPLGQVAMANVRSKKTSIYTLSEELGLSPATVSRALNNHPAVSATVRAKVQQVADRYKYKPRFVSNKVTNICVLIQQYDEHPLDFGAFLSQTLEGIAQYCRHEDVEMSLYSSGIHELNECDLVRELRRRNADGAVVLRASNQSEYLVQFDGQRFPYFCLFNNDDRPSERVLLIDDEQLAYRAVEHLIGLGHRRIGIMVSTADRHTGRSRWEGYRRALREHGIEEDDRLAATADATRHRGDLVFGASAIEELLARFPDMTAAFATSEYIARGALAWLYDHGVAVPDRISLVGFDDFPETAYTCPPLTTVRIPYLEFGYEAARQVHRLCRGLEVLLTDETRDKLRCDLVTRKSTGGVGNC